MMQQNYQPTLAAGVVVASGALCILIPPSIMLVFIADQMALSVGDLVVVAVILGVLYLTYVFILAQVKKDAAPLPEGAKAPDWDAIKDVAVAVLPILALILCVLGSIFADITTPTEASGIGVLGATALALGYRKLNLRQLFGLGLGFYLPTLATWLPSGA